MSAELGEMSPEEEARAIAQLKPMLLTLFRWTSAEATLGATALGFRARIEAGRALKSAHDDAARILETIFTGGKA